MKPLLYIDPEKYPLSVAIYSMSQAMTYRADWVTLFAGFVIMMIPTILIIVFSEPDYSKPEHWCLERLRLQKGW